MQHIHISIVPAATDEEFFFREDVTANSTHHLLWKLDKEIDRIALLVDPSNTNRDFQTDIAHISEVANKVMRGAKELKDITLDDGTLFFRVRLSKALWLEFYSAEPLAELD